MTEGEILQEGARLLAEKKQAQKHFNAAAADFSKESGVDKSVLKRIADVELHRGVGWEGDDPLSKTEEKVAHPDKLSSAFKRVLDVVEDYVHAGLSERLKIYTDALAARGIDLTWSLEDAQVDGAWDAVSNMLGFKKVAVEASDEIREVLGAEAEENNFCPANKIVEIVGLYDKRENGKEIADAVQDKLLFCTLYETALNKVHDGGEANEA